MTERDKLPSPPCGGRGVGGEGGECLQGPAPSTSLPRRPGRGASWTDSERGAILVIGYGNTQRGDDGIGPRVAEAIAVAHLPGVRVVISFQLVPELAADLAESRLAVFVDAVADPTRSDIELWPIAPAETTDWSTHTGDPRVLLALTQAVYGYVPAAWRATVPGRDFGFGECLSPLAEEGIRHAVDRIAALMRPYLR